MYGWRARLGMVSPAIYDTTALDFQKILPDGVMMVVNTLDIQNLVPEEFERVWGQFHEAARRLIVEEVDAVLIGGDPILALKGPGSDIQVINRIKQEIKDIPVTTTVTAAMEALRMFSARKLVIASPYREERNKLLVKLFEAEDFEVLGIKQLNIQRNVELSKLPVYASYKLGREAVLENPQAEALYMPCCRWPTVDSVPLLERDLGIPVVSHVPALAWWGLKELKIHEPITGWGRLMASLSGSKPSAG